MRVFLDTNVLVAALATRGLCADVLRHVLAAHELLTCDTVLAELRRALRGKLRLPEPLAEEAVDFVARQAECVPEPAPATRPSLDDPADRLILAAAAAGGAEVLVTGDAELLALGRHGALPLCSPRAFWDRARGGGASR